MYIYIIIYICVFFYPCALVCSCLNMNQLSGDSCDRSVSLKRSAIVSTAEVPHPAKVISVFELDISIHSGHLQWTVVKLSDSVGVLDRSTRVVNSKRRKSESNLPRSNKITYQPLRTMADNS
jgi:hypothetical protein